MPNIDALEIAKIPVELQKVISASPLPDLNEQPKCPQTKSAIERLLAEASAPSDPCVAGLWLLAGELDRSHEISQALSSREGSYWHAIMHRREGDFWNSKYWYRKVGVHSVLSQLSAMVNSRSDELQKLGFDIRGEKAVGLTTANRTADALVDCCELACDAKPEWRQALCLIAWWEWQLLFQFGL